MSSYDAILFTTGSGGASFASLGLIPADIDIALAFSIDLAEKFTDDAILSSDDATELGSSHDRYNISIFIQFPLHLLC
jgi:hypothetical protein